MEQHFILGKYTRVLVRKTDAIFGAGSKQYIITDRKKWSNLVISAAQWINKNSKDNAYISVASMMTRAEFNECFDFLTTNDFLVSAETSDNIFNNRYSRNHLHYQSHGMDPAVIQNKLADKTVVILGCGGIGNHVSAMLATSGVGKIILIDDDTVEITNLTRQILFTEEDVGEPKTTVLRRELMRRNSLIEITEIRMSVNKPLDIDRIPKADLWIVSADEPYQLIYWINKWCVENGQTYINSGYVNDIAVFGPFYIPNKSGCYACNASVGDLPSEEDEVINSSCKAINDNFKVATFPPVNALSASMCANDAIKFLGGYGELLSSNRRIGIWSNRLFIEERSLKRNPLCKICGMKL